MAKVYKGDTGKLRQALDAANLAPYWTHDTIFNDNSKDGKHRRLKLWFAQHIFEASQKQQRKLEQELRNAFGKRILSMYFVKRHEYTGGGKSLCIKLQD